MTRNRITLGEGCMVAFIAFTIVAHLVIAPTFGVVLLICAGLLLLGRGLTAPHWKSQSNARRPNHRSDAA